MSTNSGIASGFMHFPPMTGASGVSLLRWVSECDVSVDMDNGAILPPLILPVIPLQPLLPCETTDVAEGRLSNNAMGQLMVTLSEQLLM